MVSRGRLPPMSCGNRPHVHEGLWLSGDWAPPPSAVHRRNLPRNPDGEAGSNKLARTWTNISVRFWEGAQPERMAVGCARVCTSRLVCWTRSAWDPSRE